MENVRGLASESSEYDDGEELGGDEGTRRVGGSLFQLWHIPVGAVCGLETTWSQLVVGEQ